jgi:transposase
MVAKRPHHTQAAGRTRPQEHQQHILLHTDHITHILRAERGHRSISSTYGGEQTTSRTGCRQNKATGMSAAHMVENRPHYTHAEGRTITQEHQQHICWRTDHITHILRAEQGHRSISSTYAGEQTTSHTG